jgi:hypothetical protein
LRGGAAPYFVTEVTVQTGPDGTNVWTSPTPQPGWPNYLSRSNYPLTCRPATRSIAPFPDGAPMTRSSAKQRRDWCCQLGQQPLLLGAEMLLRNRR